jgi:hypothetical protein
MRSIRIPFFKIWYSSAFIILFTATFVLTLISPADLIYQAARNQNIANVISVSTVYFVASLFCFFIWASRIYTNRSVLRDIPKQYIPIDAGEVPRKVRRLIEKGWRRSALIAWDSRPRDVGLEVQADREAAHVAQQEEDALDGSARRHDRRFLRPKRMNETTLLSADVALKAWGRISHPGWSPPDAASGREESVQYATVVVELPHLLEAKAVSLAPPEAGNNMYADSRGSNQTLPPDPRVVAILQRPTSMGLRGYVGHLASLGVMTSPEDAETFLEQYEYARFSSKALTENQFGDLMATFARVLSTMLLDLNLVTPLLDSSDLDSVETMSISSQSQSQVLGNQSLFDEPSLISEPTDGSIRHHQPASSSASQTGESMNSIIITPALHVS